MSNNDEMELHMFRCEGEEIIESCTTTLTVAKIKASETVEI